MMDYQKILDHMVHAYGTAENRNIVASYIPEPAYIDNKNKIGMQDEVGEFTFKAGLPGKSGVGGGIVALLPNKFCVATRSPGLYPKGNSLFGMVALEKLTTKSDLSIF